jgi:hypothetical protein
MTVLLYDPEGRLAASTLLIRGRSGVELPSVSLKQGRWHLAFLTGARQDDARHFTLTVDGAQPASHAAPETRGIIGILGDAAMLAREHPDGSRDFAAMQLLQREDNEGVRDGLAEDNFCAG